MQVAIQFLQPRQVLCFLKESWLPWALLVMAPTFAQSQHNRPQVHRGQHPFWYPSPCLHLPSRSCPRLCFLENILSALTWRKQGQHPGELLMLWLLALILISAPARASDGRNSYPQYCSPAGSCTAGHIFHT